MIGDGMQGVSSRSKAERVEAVPLLPVATSSSVSMLGSTGTARALAASPDRASKTEDPSFRRTIGGALPGGSERTRCTSLKRCWLKVPAGCFNSGVDQCREKGAGVQLEQPPSFISPAQRRRPAIPFPHPARE